MAPARVTCPTKSESGSEKKRGKVCGILNGAQSLDIPIYLNFCRNLSYERTTFSCKSVEMFLAALLLVLPLATCRQLAHDEKYLKELERLAALRLEISCYALPYGGLGFTSHMLTYYTIGALAYGCQPLRPWKPLEGKWWDRPLAIVQVVGTVTFSAITMARCHQRWEFVLVALWMMTTAITLSVITIVGPLAPDRWKNPFTILVTVRTLDNTHRLAIAIWSALNRVISGKQEKSTTPPNPHGKRKSGTDPSFCDGITTSACFSG